MPSRDVLEANPEYAAAIAQQSRQKSTNDESRIVWAILDWLKLNKVPAARTQAGEVALARGGYMKLAPADWPDISGTIPNGPHRGRSLYIEVKTEEGKLRPGQTAMRQYLEAAGALFVEGRSIDDVRAALLAMNVSLREG